MVTINRYNKMMEYGGDNSIDFDGDQFFCMLMTGTHTYTAANTIRTDVSGNQISGGSGYTQATGGLTGEEMLSPTWVESGGVVTFDGADISWTASGGDIGPAEDMVLFDDTTTAVVDALMYSIDFIGPETAGDGTDFKVTWNGSGIFTVG